MHLSSFLFYSFFFFLGGGGVVFVCFFLTDFTRSLEDINLSCCCFCILLLLFVCYCCCFLLFLFCFLGGVLFSWGVFLLGIAKVEEGEFIFYFLTVLTNPH